MFQWCLGIQPRVPAYFEVCHRSQLFVATGIAPGQPTTITDFITHALAQVQPRNQEEIIDQLTEAEIWNWRAQAQNLLALQNMGSQLFRDPNTVSDEPNHTQYDLDEEVLDYANLPAAIRRMIKNLPQAIAHTSSLAYSRGLLLLTIDNDFGVPGEIAFQFASNEPNQPEIVAYRNLPDSVLEQLATVAVSRYHALAYLTGTLPDYDDPISRVDGYGQPNSVLGSMPHLWSPENDKNPNNKS